jgi:hypothetical protein
MVVAVADPTVAVADTGNASIVEPKQSGCRISFLQPLLHFKQNWN